jgi:microcystin-dependent protein
MALSDWSKTPGSNNAAVPNGAPDNWTGKDVNNWGRQTMATVRTWYDDPEWLSVLNDVTPIGAKTITRDNVSTFRIVGCNAAVYFNVGRRIRMSGAATAEAHVASANFSGSDTVVTILGSNVPATLSNVEIYFAKTLDLSAFVSLPAVGDLRLTSGRASAAAINGWKVCDGTAYAVATYPALAALYGATGFGDGVYDAHPLLGAPSAGSFRVPDLRGRVPVGNWAGGDADGDYNNFAADGGVQGDTFLGEKKHALTTAELAAHDHGSAGAHTHDLNVSPNVGSQDSTLRRGDAGFVVVDSPVTSDGAHTHASVGSGTAHENRPPSTVIGYLVYTGVIP